MPCLTFLMMPSSWTGRRTRRTKGHGLGLRKWIRLLKHPAFTVKPDLPTTRQTSQRPVKLTVKRVAVLVRITCPQLFQTSNPKEGDFGALNREYGFMAGAKDAKEKPDKQILILSMGLRTE